MPHQGSKELTVPKRFHGKRRFGFVPPLCAFALAAGFELLAAAVPVPAAAAVVARTDTAAPPTNAPRPAARRATPEKHGTRYFVEFRSRTALSYGHAYVVYGRLDARGNMIDPQVGAIHPASNSSIPYMIGHFVPVPADHGASDGDLEDQYVSARYQVILSEAEYNRVVAYIKELEASTPVWHAFLYSCTTFVNDVAKFMGLRTPPPNGIYPEVYINNLRAMNSTGDEEITLIPRVQWGLAPAAPPVVKPAE
jgi:hypothetical protein